jgi:hypothetical protein
MDDEGRQMQALRGLVQARMEGLARFDGVEWTPDNMRELCCALLTLGGGGSGGPLRIRATAEDTLLMEDYLAWVAEHFREEIARLDQLVLAIQHRANPTGVAEAAPNQALTQALTAFIQGPPAREAPEEP